MDWLSTKIDGVLAWFLATINTLWQALIDFLKDWVVYVLDGIFNAISAVIAAIPAPSFMASGSLNTLFSGLPPQLLWLISQTGVVEGFGFLAAAVGFFLLRKIVTIGQW